MKRVVITGGTYAGKTSVVELFKKDGFRTVPDVGLEVINGLNNELGKEEQKQFRADKPLEFYLRVIKRQLEYENEIKSDVVVFDRGVHDYIAMLKLKRVSIPSSLKKLIEGISYDSVFVLDTLDDFAMRKTSGRSLTKQDSQRLNKLVGQIYKELGHKVIIVKEIPLNERYEFIKKRI